MESLKRHPVFGLDSRWSWITALSCSLCLFMGNVGSRVFGIVYVGIIETFQVSREEATWPLTIFDVVTSFANLLFGFICRRSSSRAVLLGCSFLGPVAIALCYFAPNVAFITGFYGAVNGIAFSGLMVGLHVVIAQYFEKRRATAFSVFYTVAGLNTFFVPPIIEYSLAEFGLRGALLLLGAISLNAFPAAIILRSPPWADPTRQRHRFTPRPASKEAVQHADENVSLTNDNKANNVTSGDNGTTKPSKKSPSTDAKTDRSSFHAAKNFLTLRFWVDSTSFGVVYLSLALFVMLVVDLAKDRGVSTADSVYLFHAFSVGDVVMRALNGWIVDAGLLSVNSIMGLGFFVQGIGFVLMVYGVALPALVVASFLLGASIGFRMSLGTIVLILDFGVEALPIMIGGLGVVTALNSWVRAPLVGYFRDKHGSYDGVMLIMAIVSLVYLLIWEARFFIKKIAQRRRKVQVPVESGKEAVTTTT
ncbi:monocarboxylate transporter 12 [Ixodes scapularis]|uniref:monocarboxylate transporter 12 n=1 Tax=Ixodes scapularis TaxID=6945 RepID=UPI001C3875AB|nr:monocarboxylate transporter 12 [Ixodes scapularis]XP_042146959.1 monocarboxylate transporter 12 [Ixodes scapularis]